MNLTKWLALVARTKPDIIIHEAGSMDLSRELPLQQKLTTSLLDAYQQLILVLQIQLPSMCCLRMLLLTLENQRHDRT